MAFHDILLTLFSLLSLSCKLVDLFSAFCFGFSLDLTHFDEDVYARNDVSSMEQLRLPHKDAQTHSHTERKKPLHESKSKHLIRLLAICCGFTRELVISLTFELREREGERVERSVEHPVRSSLCFGAAALCGRLKIIIKNHFECGNVAAA